MSFSAIRWIQIAAFIFAGQAFVFSQGSKAVLKGRVVDPHGAVFVRAKVVATCTNSVRLTETSGAGEYQMDLEPGVCDVHVEPPFAGVSAAHRAPMELLPDTVNTAIFTLFSDLAVATRYSTASSPLETSGSALDDVPRIDFKYERVVFPNNSEWLTGLIRFGHKTNSGNTTIYGSGIVGQSGYAIPAVEFTYNLLKLEATEIRIDNERRTIYALGNVSVDVNGNIRKYQGFVQVSLIRGKILIKINK